MMNRKSMMSESAGAANATPTLTTIDLLTQERVMAEIQSTSHRVFFQPATLKDTLNVAYLLARIAERVTCAEGGCWEWSGDRDKDGYGRVSVGSKNVFVHRLIYELCVSEIPMGMQVLHHCDNPPCCNPDHLFVGTNQDNVDDMTGKGRQRRGEEIRTSKMTPETVRELRRRYSDGETVKLLAIEYGISEQSARHIIGRRSWKHVP